MQPFFLRKRYTEMFIELDRSYDMKHGIYLNLLIIRESLYSSLETDVCANVNIYFERETHVRKRPFLAQFASDSNCTEKGHQCNIRRQIIVIY